MLASIRTINTTKSNPHCRSGCLPQISFCSNFLHPTRSNKEKTQKPERGRTRNNKKRKERIGVPSTRSNKRKTQKPKKRRERIGVPSIRSNKNKQTHISQKKKAIVD
jgi:hypothetical protein